MPLPPGTRLGPYEILAPIGAGGMGEVYRARDTRLGRDVAVKVAAERFSERFEREARAVAALNHPHICTLYDVGPNYLVMEFVDGAPLKGPLPLGEALRLAMQIADALGAAHAKGITHRDLKPGNILVAAGGVKLLDFGLAKISRDGQGSVDDATETQTQAGTVLGTAAYMSPEQTGGKAIDARSDIFSFGAVLFEMVSGRRAFRGESSISTMAAILHKEPEPFDAPEGIVRIVTRCLRKAPAERFHMIAEVRAALEKVAAQPAEKTPSIAVLPFVNMSPDKDNEYFSDGLTEEIINALTKVAGLRVIPRTSAFRFRGEADLRKVGEALQVATVLEGSVRKSGNRLRITAQLINLADDSHIWTDRWDREMADVFDIQDETSQAIVQALKVKLTAKQDQPFVARKTANVEAYNAYLEGRYYVLQMTAASMARSRQSYERAIRLDPQYAAAYAGLAEYYYLLGLYAHALPRDVLPRAMASAERALELDPRSADAYSARGAFRACEFNWEAAGADFAKAIALNPADALSRFRHALFYLRLMGRHDEAVAEMKVAVELDPLHPHIRSYEVFVLHGAGQGAEALDRVRITVETFPIFWTGCMVCAWVLAERGYPEEGLAAVQTALAANPGNLYLLASMALAYSRLGKLDDARALLAQLEALSAQQHVSPFPLALACAACGEVDRCFEYLDRGLAESDAFTLLCFDQMPVPGLHSDPRYQALLRKVNLA